MNVRSYCFCALCALVALFSIFRPMIAEAVGLAVNIVDEAAGYKLVLVKVGSAPAAGSYTAPVTIANSSVPVTVANNVPVTVSGTVPVSAAAPIPVSVTGSVPVSVSVPSLPGGVISTVCAQAVGGGPTGLAPGASIPAHITGVALGGFSCNNPYPIPLIVVGYN